MKNKKGMATGPYIQGYWAYTQGWRDGPLDYLDDEEKKQWLEGFKDAKNRKTKRK